MAFLETLLGLIDLRAFSSIWFWILLSLYWASVSQAVLGASHDLILRARRGAAQAQDDVYRLVDIHVRRRLGTLRRIGHWVVGIVAAILTLILFLAVAYGLEFAQALLLLLAPMTLVRLLELRLCFRIERENPGRPSLPRLLLQHRFRMQLVGMVVIFVAAFWGMLYLASRSILPL